MQAITSAKTSRNLVPALHKKVVNELEGDVLDYGGGMYDTAINWLEANNETVSAYVYDPFNCTKTHNELVLKHCQCNFILCSNVLNVIKDKEDRIAVLKHISELAKPKTVVYFSVYKAIKSKNYIETYAHVGQETTDGWQNCQPLSFYYNEITEYLYSRFNNKAKVEKTKDYIKVTY